MEIFKTSVGSWIYPEPNFFRIGGVPLFSGFMYSCIGSYLCRAWRLFGFRFSHHPRRSSLIALSVAIYANFFAHHFMPDLRWLLFAASAALFGRTTVHFRVWRSYRSMPLLLGLLLVSLFIWFSENIGTFTRIWLYPSQRHGWSMVSPDKLGSWFMLLVISYTLVSLINVPREWPLVGATADPERTLDISIFAWPYHRITSRRDKGLGATSGIRSSISHNEWSSPCSASSSSSPPSSPPPPPSPPAVAAISTPSWPACRRRPRPPAFRKA